MRRAVISFLKWCLAKLQGPDAAQKPPRLLAPTHPESSRLLAPTPPAFPDTVRELTEEQLLQEALLNAEWEMFVFSRRWLDLPSSLRQVATPDGRTWTPGFVYPPGSFVDDHGESTYTPRHPPIGAALRTQLSEPYRFPRRISYAEFRVMYPDFDLLQVLKQRVHVQDRQQHLLALARVTVAEMEGGT